VASPGLAGGQVAVLLLHMGPFPRNRCNIVVMADESAMNFEDVGALFSIFLLFTAIFLRVGSEQGTECGFPVNRARTSCIEPARETWPAGEP